MGYNKNPFKPFDPYSGQVNTELLLANENFNIISQAFLDNDVENQPIKRGVYIRHIPPTDAVKGTLWLDISTTNPKLKLYDGNTWLCLTEIGCKEEIPLNLGGGITVNATYNNYFTYNPEIAPRYKKTIYGFGSFEGGSSGTVIDESYVLGNPNNSIFYGGLAFLYDDFYNFYSIRGNLLKQSGLNYYSVEATFNIINANFVSQLTGYIYKLNSYLAIYVDGELKYQYNGYYTVNDTHPPIEFGIGLPSGFHRVRVVITNKNSDINEEITCDHDILFKIPKRDMTIVGEASSSYPDNDTYTIYYVKHWLTDNTTRYYSLKGRYKDERTIGILMQIMNYDIVSFLKGYHPSLLRDYYGVLEVF
jgi:hypothetical protein